MVREMESNACRIQQLLLRICGLQEVIGSFGCVGCTREKVPYSIFVNTRLFRIGVPEAFGPENTADMKERWRDLSYGNIAARTASHPSQ